MVEEQRPWLDQLDFHHRIDAGADGVTNVWIGLRAAVRVLGQSDGPGRARVRANHRRPESIPYDIVTRTAHSHWTKWCWFQTGTDVRHPAQAVGRLLGQYAGGLRQALFPLRDAAAWSPAASGAVEFLNLLVRQMQRILRVGTTDVLLIIACYVIFGEQPPDHPNDLSAIESGLQQTRDFVSRIDPIPFHIQILFYTRVIQLDGQLPHAAQQELNLDIQSAMILIGLLYQLPGQVDIDRYPEELDRWLRDLHIDPSYDSEPLTQALATYLQKSDTIAAEIKADPTKAIDELRKKLMIPSIAETDFRLLAALIDGGLKQTIKDLGYSSEAAASPSGIRRVMNWASGLKPLNAVEIVTCLLQVQSDSTFNMDHRQVDALIGGQSAL